MGLLIYLLIHLFSSSKSIWLHFLCLTVEKSDFFLYLGPVLSLRGHSRERPSETFDWGPGCGVAWLDPPLSLAPMASPQLRELSELPDLPPWLPVPKQCAEGIPRGFSDDHCFPVRDVLVFLWSCGPHWASDD